MEILDNQGDLNAEFMSNLDGYLNYFDNMERDAKSGPMAFKEFYSPHNDGHRQPKHETEAASEEVKNLRKMVEKLESKLNETILSKKKLNNELITLRTKEDAYKRVSSNNFCQKAMRFYSFSSGSGLWKKKLLQCCKKIKLIRRNLLTLKSCLQRRKSRMKITSSRSRKFFQSKRK